VIRNETGLKDDEQWKKSRQLRTDKDIGGDPATGLLLTAKEIRNQQGSAAGFGKTWKGL